MSSKELDVSLQPARKSGAVFNCNGQLARKTREQQEEFCGEVQRRLGARAENYIESQS